MSNPYLLPDPAFIAFSGGRTSGYMLRHVIDAYGGKLPAHIRVLFANTGKERRETLDFVRDVAIEWGVPVVWLEYRRRDNAHAFDIVDYDSASRDGRPFNELLAFLSALPNVQGRSCTSYLKIRTMKRFVQSLGITTWNDSIGIRADESHRTWQIELNSPKYIATWFPLVRAGVTEADVLKFWSEQPFDLQLKSYEGNCDLCFLKSRGKVLNLIRENPTMADWWIKAEAQFAHKGDGGKFRLDRPSYAALQIQAKEQGFFPFDAWDDEVGCACTDGGTAEDEDDE